MAEDLSEGNYGEGNKRLRLIALGLFFGGLFVLALGAGLFFFKNQNSSSDIQIIATTKSTERGEPTEIVVHVDGAVLSPGVYKLAAGLRVDDAIKMAGGLTEDADQTKINLAAKLADGQKIYVFATGEQVISDKSQVISQSTSLVNINAASESELDKLPGVGPVTAQKIIASRPYSSLEELLTKKAVNKSVWEKIKGMIAY
ncbi:ComEA family DNA-binding protein [Candidatus Curtissbacteria bacterium]|nr:ComEA family DNA-binding protein [Candidatus Curtissbacteria bacterium]